MSRSPRLAITAVVAVAVVIGAAFAVRAIWSTASKHLASDTCTYGGYALDPSQASVAATMVGEVTKYRVPLPARASVLVLAAAMQESKLTNLAPGEGDRDSVGVLQQRPSQGWGGGSAAKLTDVAEATKEFLDVLVKLPDWQALPLSTAIQKVQISADGSLYAQHEPQSTVLADALSGRSAAAISCEFTKPNKIAPTSTVAAQVGKELGIATPTAVDQKIVRVPGARWQTAAWFVANADRLGIDQVGYAGKRWTRTRGWKSSKDPASAVVATMATP
ncbi:MAG: hypothetical protein ACR2LX_00420 [Jatrophihabitans sp.]